MFKEFDLLFFRGNSMISKIIKQKTNSLYSHVGLILSDNHIIELDWKYKLKINHLTYTNNTFDIYRLKVELTEEQKQKIRDYIYSTLNSKYDLLEILALFFGVKLRNNNKKFICSSWINECFKSCGIVFNEKEIVSPQDLISDKIYKVI